MCGGVGLYKPSSLVRPYIADTSALLMLELGLMPVVTTMVPPSLLQINKPGEERVTVINRTKKTSLLLVFYPVRK